MTDTAGGRSAAAEPGPLRRLRYKLEREIGGRMPPIMYCWLDETLRVAANPARRGGRKRSVGRDDVGLFVAWDDGERFYFNHHLLHNRYVWPDGLGTIHRFILDKYSDRDLRVREGDIVIEAGANVGEFTTAAAAKAARIYAFEPDPLTFGCLTRNTSNLPNVTLHEAGLGDFEGQAQLFLSRENSDSSFIQPGSHVGVATVPVTTLSAVMARYKLDRIDFLKVEAEGFEPEILKGAGERLAHIRKVAVDCGPERHGQSTYDECEAFLREADFTTWRRQRDWMLFATRV